MAIKAKPAPQDLSVDLLSPAGQSSGKVTLAGAVFGIEPNTGVMHQVVTAQLAAARRGTHNTKTRAEVRGGGAKPFRQKGTGRARQGSIRAPHWRGGGIAHGPKPRDYSQRTPKKMVRLALRSALSDRAAEGKVVVIGEWGFEAPKTKDARLALDALGVESAHRALVVLSSEDDAAWKSFRNLGGDRRVQVIRDGDLSAYEVLVNDWLIFTRATLDSVTQRLSAATSSSSVSPSSSDSSDEERLQSSSEASAEGAPVDEASDAPAEDSEEEGGAE